MKSSCSVGTMPKIFARIVARVDWTDVKRVELSKQQQQYGRALRMSVEQGR